MCSTIKGVVVLGADPAYRTGLNLQLLRTGKVLEKGAIILIKSIEETASQERYENQKKLY